MEFAQTQDLTPVQTFVYSVMMWRQASFLEAFKKNGYALLCGRIGYYPVSKMSSLIIKTEEDLFLAEALIAATGGKRREPVYYYQPVAGNMSVPDIA